MEVLIKSMRHYNLILLIALCIKSLGVINSTIIPSKSSIYAFQNTKGTALPCPSLCLQRDREGREGTGNRILPTFIWPGILCLYFAEFIIITPRIRCLPLPLHYYFLINPTFIPEGIGTERGAGKGAVPLVQVYIIHSTISCPCPYLLKGTLPLPIPCPCLPRRDGKG